MKIRALQPGEKFLVTEHGVTGLREEGQIPVTELFGPHGKPLHRERKLRALPFSPLDDAFLTGQGTLPALTSSLHNLESEVHYKQLASDLSD